MAYFSRLFGNEKTKARLADAVMSGTLAHALLIVGPDGSGKHTLANELIRAVLCENRKSGDALPCGRCISCRRVLDGQHTDVKIIRRDGRATLGVDEIRRARDDMFLSPNECDYKFYIIEESDLMTPQAQNSLLKVLEEPPRSVHIMLLATSEDKLLSTIKSRAQLIATERFSANSIVEYLKTLPDFCTFSVERLRAAASFSGGIIGRAISNLNPKQDEENRIMKKTVGEFLCSLSSRTDFSKLYSALSAFPTGREEFRETVEQAIIGLRDLIVTKSGADAELLFFESREEAEAALARASLIRLCNISKILTGALFDVDRNINIKTLLIDLSVRIKSA